MSNKKDWVVGDRVQRAGCIDDVGVITALIMATRKIYNYYALNKTEQYISEVTVKWDGSEEEETLNYYDINSEDSELEREFRKTAPLVLEKIYQKLESSLNLLHEAQQIAEDNGIPFSSCVSPLSQSYLARSFPDKWPGVSQDVVTEVTETYNDYDSFYGWEHSAVC